MEANFFENTHFPCLNIREFLSEIMKAEINFLNSVNIIFKKNEIMAYAGK